MSSAKKNVLQRIEELIPICSKKQKALAEFILNDHKNAAFMNSVQLGKQAQVSNATVIRFASMLGYDGFNQMQQDLQSMLQQELSSVERLTLLKENNHRKTDKTDDRLSIFYHERGNLKNILQIVNPDQITEAGTRIASSSSVVISGFQASQCLADYFKYSLSKIQKNVYKFPHWNLDAHSFVENADSSCTAIVIALSRYPNNTITFIKHLYEKKIYIILITDNQQAFPCTELANFVIEVPVAYYSYVDPFSSVFCMINSLLLEVIRQNPQKAKEEMESFEKYASENHIYYSNK